MRKTLLLFLLLSATAVVASDVVVKVDHHFVSRSSDASLATVFAEEHVVSNLQLDVYMLASIPSSQKGYSELQQLGAGSWLAKVRWALQDSAGEMKLPEPRTLDNRVRRRGPAATRAVDRDSTVNCNSFTACLDWGPLPPGDYMLTANVAGLASSFPFVVRTGKEDDVRDAYLEWKAGHAASYVEFKQLQLARYERDSSRLDPVFLVIDRALLESTLTDTRELFALALQKMEERRRIATEPAKIQFFDRRVRELRETERALPDYFARRNDWIMVRDMSRGSYVMKDRRTGAVVRDFESAER